MVLFPRLEYLRAEGQTCADDYVLPTGCEDAYQKPYVSLVTDISEQEIGVHMQESRNGNGLQRVPKSQWSDFCAVYPEGANYRHEVQGATNVLFTRDRPYKAGSLISLKRTSFPRNVKYTIVKGTFTEESMIRLFDYVKQKQLKDYEASVDRLATCLGISAVQQKNLFALAPPRDNEELFIVGKEWRRERAGTRRRSQAGMGPSTKPLGGGAQPSTSHHVAVPSFGDSHSAHGSTGGLRPGAPIGETGSSSRAGSKRKAPGAAADAGPPQKKSAKTGEAARRGEEGDAGRMRELDSASLPTMPQGGLPNAPALAMNGGAQSHVTPSLAGGQTLSHLPDASIKSHSSRQEMRFNISQTALPPADHELGMADTSRDNPDRNSGRNSGRKPKKTFDPANY